MRRLGVVVLVSLVAVCAGGCSKDNDGGSTPGKVKPRNPFENMDDRAACHAWMRKLVTCKQQLAQANPAAAKRMFDDMDAKKVCASPPKQAEMRAEYRCAGFIQCADFASCFVTVAEQETTGRPVTAG